MYKLLHNCVTRDPQQINVVFQVFCITIWHGLIFWSTLYVPVTPVVLLCQ